MQVSLIKSQTTQRHKESLLDQITIVTIELVTLDN